MASQATQALGSSIFAKLSIAPAVLAVVFIIKALFPVLWDPDTYWHLKIGEYVATHGALPLGEPFTYTHAGAPLNHSEWLFQTILYLVHAASGFAGVTIMVAAFYTACCYVTYLSCRRIFDDEGKAIVIAMLFCSAVWGASARPQLVTYLFLALTLYVLVDFKYGNGLRKLWLMPPLMAFWVNAHGGFVLGLVLFWAFTASEWSMFLLRCDRRPAQGKRLRILIWVALMATLATLANPGYFDAWSYFFKAVVNSPDTALVTEWQSPNFHVEATQYFLLTVFMFFVGAAWSAKRPDLTELGIPLIFIGGAFYSQRNIPYAAFAMAPFFAVFLKSTLAAVQTTSSAGLGSASPLARFARAVTASGNRDLGQKEALLNWLLVGTTLTALTLIYPSYTQKMQKEMERLLPVKAMDFVIAEGIEGRIFNTYHAGGYIIYRLRPDQKVFIYPRTDFYRPGFFKEYTTIYYGAPGWKPLFTKYDIDYVVCEHTAALRQLLLEGQDYRLVFDDGNHAVLVRNSQRFHDVIQKYGTNPASA